MIIDNDYNYQTHIKKYKCHMSNVKCQIQYPSDVIKCFE